MFNNFSAWTQAQVISTSASKKETAIGLLRYAILAPSTHNSQPWKFLISSDGTTIDIFREKNRSLPIADPNSRFAYLSLGAAVGILERAAQAHGIDFKTEVFSLEDTPEPPVRIHIFSTPTKTAPDQEVLRAIVNRRSNRNPHTPRPLPSSFIEQISSLENSNAKIAFKRQHEEIVNIGNTIVNERLALFDDAKFRLELSKYKRTNITWNCLGIPGNTMGFSLLKSFFAPMAIRSFNVVRQTEKQERILLVDQTNAYAMVYSNTNTPTDAFFAGKLISLALLQAEQDGLAAQIIAFPDNEPFRVFVPQNTSPQLILRFGYASKSPPHSPRLPLERVIHLN